MSENVSIWIVGTNRPGYLPDSPPSVATERADAIELLKYQAQEFAEAVDDEARERNEFFATEAHVESLFAEADGIIPPEGPVSFMLTDNDGWGHVFFMAESKDKYFLFEDEYMVATEALASWVSTIPRRDVLGGLENRDSGLDEALRLKVGLAHKAIESVLMALVMTVITPAKAIGLLATQLAEAEVSDEDIVKIFGSALPTPVN